MVMVMPIRCTSPRSRIVPHVNWYGWSKLQFVFRPTHHIEGWVQESSGFIRYSVLTECTSGFVVYQDWGEERKIRSFNNSEHWSDWSIIPFKATIWADAIGGTLVTGFKTRLNKGTKCGGILSDLFLLDIMFIAKILLHRQIHSSHQPDMQCILRVCLFNAIRSGRFNRNSLKRISVHGKGGEEQ